MGDDDDGGGLGVDLNSKIVWKSRLRDLQQYCESFFQD